VLIVVVRVSQVSLKRVASVTVRRARVLACLSLVLRNLLI
jgi:hypothetical protein